MQVKQRLRIHALVSTISVLAILIVLLLTVYRVNRALEVSRLANEIMNASFERLILRTDNHRTGSERSKVQLIAKHKQVGDLLKSALDKFRDPEDRKIVKELLVIHESIGKASRTIRENREKRGPHAPPDMLAQDIEDRLLSQLNMRVYEAILLDGKLQESGNAAVVSSLRQAASGILLVLLIVSATTLVNTRIMNRAITDRVARLADGAALIGGGDLEHRIDIRGDDEFAGLAGAFNAMTAKLSGSYRDLENEIKERKGAETSLQKASDELAKQVEERTRDLREKEVMLKEIHHRVKNNLQVISSLVSLQADGSQDETVREVLRDVTYRVRSMALVHEKLYQSADLARVDFAEYARSLLSYLWRAHGVAAAAVRLTLDLEPVLLPIDTAIPCGLILNELAGNALKHAFRGRSEGEVAVSLHHCADDIIRLRVADNGVGLPAGLDWRQAPSLGLRLVQLLSRQIGAGVEAGGEKGTEFEIAFSVKCEV